MAMPPSIAAEAIKIRVVSGSARKLTPPSATWRASKADGRCPPGRQVAKASTRRCSRSLWRSLPKRSAAQRPAPWHESCPTRRANQRRRRQAPQQVAGVGLLGVVRATGKDREEPPGETGDSHQQGTQRVGRRGARHQQVQDPTTAIPIPNRDSSENPRPGRAMPNIVSCTPAIRTNAPVPALASVGKRKEDQIANTEAVELSLAFARRGVCGDSSTCQR